MVPLIPARGLRELGKLCGYLVVRGGGPVFEDLNGRMWRQTVAGFSTDGFKGGARLPSTGLVGGESCRNCGLWHARHGLPSIPKRFV